MKFKKVIKKKDNKISINKAICQRHIANKVMPTLEIAQVLMRYREQASPQKNCRA